MFEPNEHRLSKQKTPWRKSCAILVLFLTVGANTAQAQLPSLPVYYRPVHDPYPSYSVNLDYGIGTKDISELKYLGVRGSIEGEKVRGSVAVGSVMPDAGSNKLAFGGSFSYNLIGPFKRILGPCVVDLQGGVGYFELDSNGGKFKQWDFPIGLAIGIPALLTSEKISNIEPWAALGLHLRHSKLDDAASISKFREGFGIACGLNIILTNGLGFHLAAEIVSIKEPFGDDRKTEIPIGLGLDWWR